MTLAILRILRTLLAVSILATPAVALAQITQVPSPIPGVFPSYTHRNSLAFDPVNDVYLAIVWDPPFGPILSGRFLDKAGNPIGGDFVIAIDDVDGEGNPAFASWSSIAFGGPPNDPAFIVTYVVSLDGSTGIKYARLVRYVGGAPSITPRVTVADVGGQWFASEKAQSFWNGQRFVVGTRLHLPGFSFPSPTVNLVDMALNVSPSVDLGDGADFYGSPALACGNGVCLAFGFKAGISGGFSGGSYGRLFSATTLAPQGSGVIPVNALGANEDQAVVYQKHAGTFLTQWFRVAGGWIDTRLVLPDGTLGAANTAAGPNAGMNTFTYNQFTQTTLLTFKDSAATLYAWELNDQGLPIRPNNFLTLTAWDGAINDYLPSIAANEEDGQWFVTYRLASSSFGMLVTGTYVDPTSVPLTILTNGNMAPATQTVPYAQLMLASGGVIPHSWSMISGALPPGMTLNGAHLSGTPTTPGTFIFRMRVTSTDGQVAERDFTLGVQAIISVPPGGSGAHIEGLTPLYLTQALGKRNNLAYDPISRVYLTTVSDGQMPIVGRWVDRTGLIGWAPDFIIADDIDPNTGELAFMGFFGITFGGPPNDPVFLVTYIVADNAANTKYGRFVRYSNGAAIISGRFPITNVGSEWLASEKAQAFWNGERFVVGTRVMAPGHSLPTPQVQLMDLAGNVTAPVVLGDGADFYGSPALSCAANGICIAIGFKAGIPTGYTGGTYSRRFNGASLAPLGSLVNLATNAQNEDQGVVYQTHTGHFLAQWWRTGGYIDTRLIGTDGSMSLLDLSRGIGPDSGDNAIAFNEGTHTSLLVTKRSDAALVVMELGDDGYPINGSQVVITAWDGAINAFYPSIASNNADRQWLVTSRLTAGTVGRIIQGTPTSSGLPVQNWNFSTGLSNWSAIGQPSPTDFVTTINNGVLEFYRQPLAPGTPGQGVVLQALGVPMAAGAPVAADFDIGNSSSVRKRITVILHDLDFSDLQMCTFWLAPGAPLRTYSIRSHTTRNWANATIAFYAATTGSDGGAYRLDNVRVYSMPGQAVDRTECVDPTTPAPQPLPDSGTLLANGDFSGGLAPWGTFGQMTSQIVGGVFQFARPAGTPAGVVLQATGFAMPNDVHVRFTATLSLGNSSGVRRRVTVLVHDSDFSDLAGCTFWLEPGQPLSVYRVKLFTTKPWGNTTVAVYPSEVNASPWILLDNVSLQITHSASLTGTECIEPPPGLAQSGLRSASAAGDRSASAPAQASQGLPQRPVDRVSATWLAVASETGTQAFLWAPPIDLRESIAPVLHFESQLSAGESEAFVEVTRDGVNWIRVARIPSSDEWSTIAVDLAAFSGDVIYVRFVYAGAQPVGGAPIDAWAIRMIQVDRHTPRTIQRQR